MSEQNLRELSINPSAWAKRGMIPEGTPFIEYVDSMMTGSKALRVFVSTQVYPDWPHWSRAAKSALDLVLLGSVIEGGGGAVSVSELPPIRKGPLFVIREANNGIFNVITVWINAAAITSEREFDAAMLVAKEELRKRGQKLADSDVLPPMRVIINQYDGMTGGEMLAAIQAQNREREELKDARSRRT